MLIQELIKKIESLKADETIISNTENILPKGWTIKRVMELYEEETWEVYNKEGVAVINITLTETTLRPDGGSINLSAVVHECKCICCKKNSSDYVHHKLRANDGSLIIVCDSCYQDICILEKRDVGWVEYVVEDGKEYYKIK